MASVLSDVTSWTQAATVWSVVIKILQYFHAFLSVFILAKGLSQQFTE
jgi:hypothetical protein